MDRGLQARVHGVTKSPDMTEQQTLSLTPGEDSLLESEKATWHGLIQARLRRSLQLEDLQLLCASPLAVTVPGTQVTH